MIKIIKGSYGKRDGHVVRAVGCGTVLELSAEEEARLVRIGVAEKVTEEHPVKAAAPSAPSTPEDAEHDEPEAEDKEPVQDEFPEYSADMKLEELKTVAAAYKVDVSGLRSKKEIVAALDEARAILSGGDAADTVVDG